MRKLRRWVLPDTYLAFVLAGLSILPLLYLISRTNYLLFHSLAEMFSIVIACAVFVVFWNSRQFLDNGYFLFIGIAFLFIGGLDLLHLCCYFATNPGLAWWWPAMRPLPGCCCCRFSTGGFSLPAMSKAPG
jgi:hypothetical protein